MAQKNYITPAGFEKITKELHDLKHCERPEVTKLVAWAASNGDRSENGDYIYGKRRLRQIDSRIHFLSKRIDDAEVIDPAKIKSDTIQFGATVTLLDEDDRKKTYSIVGEDEIDLSKGYISWLSPLGGALLRAKAKVGDYVTYQTPKGELEVEVVDIKYQQLL